MLFPNAPNWKYKSLCAKYLGFRFLMGFPNRPVFGLWEVREGYRGLGPFWVRKFVLRSRRPATVGFWRESDSVPAGEKRKERENLVDLVP